MEKQELIAAINVALADEFEVEVSDMTLDANIKETLHLDSLSLVDMAALIESVFQVKIKSSDVGRILTFGNLYDHIYEQMHA